MTNDQIYIPESERPFPAEKNPHCSSDMWRPQEDLADEDDMRDPNWYPKGTNFNIYNKEDYERGDNSKTMLEHGKQA